MKRLHLFELEDQPWFPRVLRDGVTDFLQFAVTHGGLYQRFGQRLSQAVSNTRSTLVVDLCSGGGGPWPELHKQVDSVREGRTTVVLTDFYPNTAKLAQVTGASAGRIRFHTHSVSALNVSADLHGFRTLFSSFHHFDPPAARAIIADAVAKGCGIAVAESTQRHPLLVLYMLLTPLFVLASTPLIRPFRWSRLLFTYLIPLIPLTVAFDGVVSCLRTYSPDELMALVRQVPGHEAYEWEAGIDRYGALPVGVTYLLGQPSPPRDAG